MTGHPVREHPSGAAGGRIDEHLEQIRAGIGRLTPHEAMAAMQAGALLVDIRDSARREENGRIPGALELEMTALEWRLDPTSGYTSVEALDPERPVVIMCNEGYASSLAVHRLGWLRQGPVTDLIGGYAGWCEAGLPVEATPDVGEPVRSQT